MNTKIRLPARIIFFRPFLRSVKAISKKFYTQNHYSKTLGLEIKGNSGKPALITGGKFCRIFLISFGFSVIELMITIAIIGILASIAKPKLQRFKVLAMRAEAKQNLNVFRSLIRAYHDENGFPETILGIGPNPVFSANGHSQEFYLVTNNQTDAQSCRNQNIYGIQVTDCRKVRYDYRFLHYNNGVMKGWRIGAHSTPRICPDHPEFDRIYYCPGNDTFRLNADASRGCESYVSVESLSSPECIGM